MADTTSRSGPVATDLLADIGDEWWDDSDYALRHYVGPAPDDDLIASVEAELSYRLPASYVALMRRHNGGLPRRTFFPTATATTWAPDHVAVNGIYGIGRTRDSLCGAAGSRFWIQDWGYPPLGVYFADCPSGGHDMIAMDYRVCGPDGAPSIVHVDQELDFAVTVLADSFASFIRGLHDGG